MCGIVGYVGDGNTLDILLDGLRRLEYRGYDSAGVALLANGGIEVRRKKGKLAMLAKELAGETITSSIGLGHTRWATHGRPSDENAHPHQVGRVAVVHNGIIENYRELKKELADSGRSFTSETDTEIIAHLVDVELDNGASLPDAVRKALKRVRGTYALGVLSVESPDCLVVARNGSPLVIGFGENQNFVASDIPAVLPYTREVAFLDDGEIAVVSKHSVEISTLAGAPVQRARRTVDWSPAQAEKGGYRHFMLKEIFEQPRALVDTLTGRLPKNGHDEAGFPLDKGRLDASALKKLTKMVAIGCGTSWHACMVGRHVIEHVCRFPVEVDLASEFRYRDPMVDETTLAVFVSQSGETADTLGALREARSKGAQTLAICNVVDSTIAREADMVLYTHAGPEIGVASTKTFVTQLAAFYLMALWIGRLRGQDDARAAGLRDALLKVPHLVERALVLNKKATQAIARKYVGFDDYLYLGRGLQHAIALEGALKLKEISYIHAEGYAAGEMKHGPIALIDDGLPIVAIAPKGRTYDKMCSAIEEVRARGGHVIAIAFEGDEDVERLAEDTLFVPETPELLAPLVTVIPLQLLAYHVAVLRGTDIDQPRNLAKSVTVE